jgi:Ser/Thr protein kinase RdoA (MazF antagonist)
MHLALDDFQCSHDRFAIDLDHLLKEPIDPIRRLLAHRPEDIDYLESLSLLLQNRINRISSELDWGVCHGDLHGGNVHFQDSALTHFDFDCGGFGWRAYDLSVFLWARVRGRGKEHFNNERWSEFLESYQKHKMLSVHDIEVIPTFVAIREIWLMGLHTGNSPIWGAWQDDHYFNTSLQFLREWCSENSIN